jgi:hypothetical protein
MLHTVQLTCRTFLRISGVPGPSVRSTGSTFRAAFRSTSEPDASESTLRSGGP